KRVTAPAAPSPPPATPPAPPPAPPAPPAPPPPAVGTRTNPLPIGTTGVAQAAAISARGQWSIRVTGVQPDAWPEIAATNIFNTAPAPGYVDFMVLLSVTWNGDAPATISDLF